MRGKIWSIGKICFALVCCILLMLFFGSVRPYVVLSGSMEPAIRTGSLCFVNTKADYEKIQEGEVIAYQKTSTVLVTHRVIEKTGEGLITKGDANENDDGFSVTEKNFVGKTLFSIPYAGYFLKYFPFHLCILVCLSGWTVMKIKENL